NFCHRTSVLKIDYKIEWAESFFPTESAELKVKGIENSISSELKPQVIYVNSNFYLSQNQNHND
ncbi:hypothetical protein MK131_16755, partial [Candidatus Poribacteria bacterium]|nr:hypothetical protein [Candidatus Poribacteria bacterium]